MKETRQKYPIPDFDPETYTDPILEECYQMKREFSAQFKDLDELHDYLVAQGKKRRKEGKWKYAPLPPHLTEDPDPGED